MADGSLASLSLLTFLVAEMQTGFGAFISVHLTARGWHPGEIGEVLSAATIAMIASQLPIGILVDGSSHHRRLAATAIGISMLSLLALAAAPGFLPVLLAMAAAGVAGPLLAQSIAAITLALTRQAALAERLGINARFAAIGAAVGAGVLGLVGTAVSDAAVFLVAAAGGAVALWALFRIPRDDLLRAVHRTSHLAAPPARKRRKPAQRVPRLLRDRGLLAFLACIVAFQLTNASLLPLAATEAVRRAAGLADVITGAATVVPQVMVALLSPWVGRMAARRGRRSILLLGFLALPIRALIFACGGSPELLVAAQTLDGVSASVVGVLLPLVIADLTHNGGRFNVALGMAGVASALGAAASNAAAGAIADRVGLSTTFVVLACLGAGATALVWLIMPETAHLPEANPARVAATAR